MLKVLLVRLMQKTQPLCSSAEWNLGVRVLGVVEKNSFIALAEKGVHSRFLSPKIENRVFPPGRIW